MKMNGVESGMKIKEIMLSFMLWIMVDLGPFGLGFDLYGVGYGDHRRDY